MAETLYYGTVLSAQDKTTATGVVRVEVRGPPASDGRPVTVPHTVFVRALQATDVDVLATDFDPAGGVLVITDAASPGDASTPAVKNAPGAVRHDLPPLTSRFPLLGEPTGSTWFAGTVGSDRAPGPSTYWIDAVVEVPSSTVASLLAEHSPVPAVTAPDEVPELASEVPAGELLAVAKAAAEQLKKINMGAHKNTKLKVRKVLLETLDQAIALDQQHFG